MLDTLEIQGPGNRFTDALVAVLGRDAPQLRGLSRKPGETITDTLRRTLAMELRDSDLVTNGPPPTADATLSLGAFDVPGITLSAGQHALAVLLGDQLPLADTNLTETQRMAVLLRSPEHWDDAVTRVAVTVAARTLTLSLDLVDIHNGTVTRYRTPNSPPPVVLATDGAKFHVTAPRDGGAAPHNSEGQASTARSGDSLRDIPTTDDASLDSTTARNTVTPPEFRTIVDSEGRSVGKASLPEAEWDRDKRLLSGLAKAERFRITNTHGATGSRSWEVPWKRDGTDTKPFFVVLHGDSGGVTVHHSTGPADRVDAATLAGALNNLQTDTPVVLIACNTGVEHRAGTGLKTSTQAQSFANATGRPVFAPTTTIGVERRPDGTTMLYLRPNSDSNTRVGFRRFTPTKNAEASRTGLLTADTDAIQTSRTARQNAPVPSSEETLPTGGDPGRTEDTHHESLESAEFPSGGNPHQGKTGPSPKDLGMADDDFSDGAE
ncbi:hypothetical protein ACFVFJ_50320, partial [Streptomyces sp. NPDC057717]|uniref:hypothetical protein n=1 Tax=Streptomyces sp. NPDC057717 TaxID=3346224 RepID=UPI0036815B36